MAGTCRIPEGEAAAIGLSAGSIDPSSTHYVALSRHLEEYLEQQVDVPSSAITQIYNGVDTERFRPNRGARPAIPGCPFGGPDHWLVGTVGRMEAIKDPLNLASAFVRAIQVQPAAAKHLRLVIVGDGALRNAVSAVLDRPGIRDRVWFAGERADVPDIMRGLDCFVLPSLAEGVSNTILEAMATVLPVDRDPRRRECRTDRIGDDRNSRPARRQRCAGARDARLFRRPR